jgi:hypothetical protein
MYVYIDVRYQLKKEKVLNRIVKRKSPTDEGSTYSMRKCSKLWMSTINKRIHTHTHTPPCMSVL